MALITKPNTFSAGATILSAEHNENFDTVYNLVNGNIDNNNIKASAGIVDTKLAQITSAGKVSGTALTGLASTPSGAGVLPFANMDTIDEDDMATDSATKVPTQQSVKAYVDSQTVSSKIVNVVVTSTGSLGVTGVGFQPKAITFVLVQNEDRGGQMTGICDSSRNLRCSGSSKQPDGNVFFKYSASTIVLYREGGTKSCEFTVTSLDADGFTINRTTAHASALCYAICYK